jgi:flagellar biosynthesis GTPase FlhF
MVRSHEEETKELKQERSQMVQQLAIRDRSHEELKQRAEKAENEAKEQRLLKEQSEKEAKEKLQRALKFNQATKQVEPQEYIYIATTENYSLENKFKPGGCGSFDLTKSRLSQYNSGKSDSNSHFFVYLRKVVSYRSIEQALLGCLGGFRENANKELYIINFDWLVKCIDAVVDHNTEFLLFVNSNRGQMVEDTMNKAPVARKLEFRTNV